jgi:hypothetical protein
LSFTFKQTLFCQKVFLNSYRWQIQSNNVPGNTVNFIFIISKETSEGQSYQGLLRHLSSKKSMLLWSYNETDSDEKTALKDCDADKPT